MKQIWCLDLFQKTDLLTALAAFKLCLILLKIKLNLFVKMMKISKFFFISYFILRTPVGWKQKAE